MCQFYIEKTPKMNLTIIERSLFCHSYQSLEKIMYAHLVSFLDKRKFVTNEQFGFRKNISTELTLLNKRNCIYVAFAGRKVAIRHFC